MLSRNYRDVVTYWGAPTPDGEGGESFSTPRQLRARWEDRNDEFNTPTGETLISRATVFVEEDLLVGGYLFQGISAEPVPTRTAAQEIRAFIKIPNIRYNDAERKALCI